MVARDEIKSRIEQRDKYSIQLTIALGEIIAVSFSQDDLRRVLMAAPLVSLYFVVLILYSYRVHEVLALYLKEKLEPALSQRIGTSIELEWENFYGEHRVPGIRRQFFLGAHWVVTLLSIAYLLATEVNWDWKFNEFEIALFVVSLIYLLVSAWFTVYFGRGRTKS